MVVVLLACELGITQPAKLFEEKTNTDLIMPGTNEAGTLRGTGGAPAGAGSVSSAW